MKSTIVIHPFLFAIFPIIFLFSFNVNSVLPEEIIVPLIFVIAVTFLIWIALGFLLKNRIKSGFIVSMGLVVFFSYGHIYILFEKFLKAPGTFYGRIYILLDEFLMGFYHEVLIIAVLFVFALSTYYFIRTKKSLNNLTKIVNGIAASLVIISLFGIGEYFITESFSQNEIDVEIKKQQVHTSEPKTQHVSTSETKKLPDVYYIIFDGYSGSKSLQTILNYDNSDFTDFLINKGFYVATESYSNYKLTRFSLASTLNMKYFNYLAEIKGIDSRDVIELIEISRNSEVIKNFKSLGYTTYNIETGSFMTQQMENIDFRLCTWKTMSTGSEFRTMLIRTTILSTIQMELFSNETREKFLCGFAELINVGDRNESPKFVLAHSLITHGPWLFGPTGEPRYAKLLTIDKLDQDFNSELYLDQLEFTNLKMKEVISKLTDTNDPPIIIIQSDHGMRGKGSLDAYESIIKEHGMRGNVSSTEYEAILRDHNNFKAYYFPGVGRNIEFETTTPVNSFRVLFNLYFDYDYDLLEDKIYEQKLTKPYEFRDVTEILIKN